MCIGHHKEIRKLMFRVIALRRSSDKGLTLKTSAFESLYGGQFTLSTQLIKTNYLYVISCLTFSDRMKSLNTCMERLLMVYRTANFEHQFC